MAGERAGDPLRSLPAVDRVVAALGSDPSLLATQAARAVLEEARARIVAGSEAPSVDEIVGEVQRRLDTARSPTLHRVINATGVLIHTNLGRVPMSDAQIDAVRHLATGYSDLELDLDTGGRGRRYAHTADLLCALTGAEGALVVNNNAAAVLLVLVALAPARDVIVSRGELVEIGGEFRIPDLMQLSTSRLVEVGTTNRTRIEDYERAIGPETGAILKVHPSNYRIVGFTASVGAQALAQLARGRGIPFVYDVGSGLVEETAADWAGQEPAVRTAIRDGCDLVTFSGDKLLGGPQAGVIVGRKRMIEGLKDHPLTRALRVDKMTIAALHETVRSHVEKEVGELPLWRLALAPLDGLERRARHLAERVGQETDPKVEATPLVSVAGGGSAPGGEIPSWGVAVTSASLSPDDLQARLRAYSPPVIARIENDRVLLDLRTVFERDDEVLANALARLKVG